MMRTFLLQGLGRNFLRHLRRTRLLVHVVDAAAEDPVNDYRTVKEVYLFLFLFFPLTVFFCLSFVLLCPLQQFN